MKGFQFAAAAALLAGVAAVGSGEDKKVTSPNHLSFTLSAPATVYVVYDKRGKKLPAWLGDSSWQPTTETLSASGGDVQASPMKVFARSFPAGSVTLGDNLEPPGHGATSNYVVIIKPSSP